MLDEYNIVELTVNVVEWIGRRLARALEG